MKMKKSNNNNSIDTKPSNVFNYLKSLSQEARDLMDEIEDVDHDIDKYNPQQTFVGLQDIFKTSWRQTKCLLGICI